MSRRRNSIFVAFTVCAACAAAWLSPSPDDWNRTALAAAAKADTPNAGAGAPAPTTFVELRKIEDEQAGWKAASNADVARLFQAERDRLGEAFGAELLKYLKGHSERHYWAGAFLTSDTYLGGREPDMMLGLMVMENGVFHCLADQRDVNEQARVVSLSILSAITSARMGLDDLAAAHKRRAVARGRNFPGPFPAVSPEERAIYDTIKVEDTVQEPPATAPAGKKAAKGKSNDGL